MSTYKSFMQSSMAMATLLSTLAIVACQPEPSALAPSFTTSTPIIPNPSPLSVQEQIVVAPKKLTIAVGGHIQTITPLSTSDGNYAMIYDTDRNTYYSYQTPDGTWTTQRIDQIKSPTWYREPLAIQQDNRLLVFQADNWYDSAGRYQGQGLELTERSGGAWSKTKSIFRDEEIGVFDAAFSSDGQAAAIWTNFTRDPSKLKLYYAEENPGKSWSSPVLVSEGKDLVLPKLVKGEDGRLALLAFESLQRDQSGWQRSTSGRLVIFQREVNGDWGPPTALAKLSGAKAYLGQFGESTVKMFWKDHRIQLLFGAYDVGGVGALYEMTQFPDGTWPEPTLIAQNATGEFQVWSQGGSDQKTLFWLALDGTTSTIMSAQQTVSGWAKPTALVGPIDRYVRLLTLAPTAEAVHVFWDEGKYPISQLKTATIAADLKASAITTVQTVPESPGPFLAITDNQHRVNILWTQGRGLAYIRLADDSVLEQTYPVDPDGALYTAESIALDEEGNPHIAGEVKPGRFDTVRYGKRLPDGSWKTEVAATGDENWYALVHPHISVAEGIVHLLFSRLSNTSAEIVYIKRQADGTWSSPDVLGTYPRSAAGGLFAQFKVTDGQLNLEFSGVTRVLGTAGYGSWTSLTSPGVDVFDPKRITKFPDGKGNSYVIWADDNPLGYRDVWFKVVRP